MRRYYWSAVRVAMVHTLWFACAVHAAEKIEFIPVPGFPQVPRQVSLGKCSAVAVDSRSQVYLLHRGKMPILCFDRNGKFLRGWGDEFVHTPHGLRIDRRQHLG